MAAPRRCLPLAGLAAEAGALGDVLLFFLLGCMARWNGDLDCEPVKLTGCPLGMEASCRLPEHRNPALPLDKILWPKPCVTTQLRRNGQNFGSDDRPSDNSRKCPNHDRRIEPNCSDAYC
jgi:hypothetical protein